MEKEVKKPLPVEPGLTPDKMEFIHSLLVKAMNDAKPKESEAPPSVTKTASTAPSKEVVVSSSTVEEDVSPPTSSNLEMDIEETPPSSDEIPEIKPRIVQQPRLSVTPNSESRMVLRKVVEVVRLPKYEIRTLPSGSKEKIYYPPRDFEKVLDSLGARSQIGRSYSMAPGTKHTIIMRGRRIGRSVAQRGLKVPEPYPNVTDQDSFEWIFASGYKSAKSMEEKNIAKGIGKESAEQSK